VTDSPSPETNTNPSTPSTPATEASDAAEASQPSDAAAASEAAATAASTDDATPSEAAPNGDAKPDAQAATAAAAATNEPPPTIASDVTRRALGREFSIPRASVDHLIEALENGLEPPYLGRFARGATRLAQEGLVRRFAQRLDELDELDRRRGTVVRTLEGADGVSAKTLELARTTVDRNVLEDLYLPYRQPEPEVQLALDRGLGALADRLTESVKGDAAASDAASSDEAPASADGAQPDASSDAAPQAEDPSQESEPEQADAQPADAHRDESGAAAEAAPETSSADAPTPDGATPDDAASAGATPDDATPDASTPDDATPAAEAPKDGDAQPDGAAEATADARSDADAQPDAAPESSRGPKKKGGRAKAKLVPVPAVEPAFEVGPDLARACQEFVATDKDVHSERDALDGAMRVLSDRLGRDPHLRAQLRKALRRHAVVTTRAGTNEERLKRHKGLLKLETPINQLQGPRLLGLRQAQRERALHVGFEVSAEHVMPKIKAALAQRPDPRFDGVLDVVAWRAWTRRLRPVLEEDLRLDLKGRADDEATRLLIGQIRQLLMAPTLGPKPAAGIDIDARGDMTVAAVDERGVPTGPEVRIAVEGKDDLDLAESLAEALRPTGATWVALAAGRGSRTALARVRSGVAKLGGEAVVTVVNDVGLSAWANSENARTELPEVAVPGRMALGLARRLQDPMAELLKVDPRHWGIGAGTSLLTKAASKRVVRDAIQSCVCTVGVDMGRATVAQLVHLPGVDRAKAAKLVELREAGSLGGRAALEASGLFDATELRNVIAFMRFRDSKEPFDRSSMHPEQYDLAAKVIEATGRPFLEVYTQNGGLKGVKRADFEVDEATWRDLQREITYPGRDPRPRLFPPKMLPPGTTAESLEKGQVVEGIVTTVTNFGAFVDIGADKEGLVHVSRVSNRFVRDAREAVSIGQVVRCVVVDPSAQRVGLSIKDAPSPERGPRGPRSEQGGERGQRRGGGGGRRERGQRGSEAWPEPQRMSRVAHSRRDGMPGQDGGGERRGGGRGKGGPGRGGGPGGGRGPGRGRDGGRRDGGRREGGGRREDLAALKGGPEKSGYSPFAKFFKSDDEPKKTSAPVPKSSKAEADPPKPKEGSSAQAPLPDGPASSEE